MNANRLPGFGNAIKSLAYLIVWDMKQWAKNLKKEWDADQIADQEALRKLFADVARNSRLRYTDSTGPAPMETPTPSSGRLVHL